MIQFSYLWANLMPLRIDLRLKTTFFVELVHPIQSFSNHTLQKFICFMSKLFCCHRCTSKSTFNSKSDTMPLLSIWGGGWGGLFVGNLTDVHGSLWIKLPMCYSFIEKKHIRIMTNNLEYSLNILIFNTQARTIHRLFLKIWKLDMVLHKLMHMFAKFHKFSVFGLRYTYQKNRLQDQVVTYIDSKKICYKSKWETVYKYSILPTKSLVIGLVTPTLQRNVNSLWHALIKCHAILFTEIGVHEHTLSQFSDTSWRCCKFVQASFEKCPEVFNGIHIRRLCMSLMKELQ